MLWKNKYIITSVLYVLIFGIVYFFIPILFLSDIYVGYTFTLSKITILSCIVFVLSLMVNSNIRVNLPRVVLSFDKVLLFTFSFFFFTVLVTTITAPNIPILEALRGGGDKSTLGESRADFLKNREGWQSLLAYLIGIVNGALLPFLLAKSFEINHRLRYVYLIFVFSFSLIFLQKAYFLKILLPLFTVFFVASENKIKIFFKSGVIIFLIFFIMYHLSGSLESNDISSQGDFLSMYYAPNGIFQSLFWRIIVIPILTALDAIKVFTESFNNTFFMGATSSPIAFLLQEERINFERELFRYQFGGDGSGNANFFYIVEAYINFGYFGVILFSLFVGRFVRVLLRTNEAAAFGLIPLLFFNLFNAGLIGTLLSNGFILLLPFFKQIVFIDESKQ